jgi:uncharacterized repeat protein (TIGR03803 family)
VNKPTSSKVICILFVFCAATAIPSPAQVLTTLHSFNGSDGAAPYGLVRASDGNFYGTTWRGGSNSDQYVCPYGCGTVFRITPSGTLTTLYSFCSQTSCGDGANPLAGLVQASDGNFYGTTSGGGAYESGTVFKITPTGTLTTLYSFCSQRNCPDGASPYAGLVQGSDGNFYGTTAYGGILNEDCGGTCGTVFQITPSGALITLYNFCSQPNCADGYAPFSGLIQASDGNFYGETGGYGEGGGTVFKITPTGTLTTLYNSCSQPNCADGSNPGGGLVQASDGNFYGTTAFGGANNQGTVFKITPSGTLTTLYSLSGSPNNGAGPSALIQASDGNFYGATTWGGASGYGTIFKITPSGTLTTLHSFDYTDGAYPQAGLVQANDGNFFGTTSHGGASSNCDGGCGTVFRLVLPRPCIVCPSAE